MEIPEEYKREKGTQQTSKVTTTETFVKLIN